MAFIGNTPTTQAFTPAVDVFSGNGSTTAFTLSRPVASVAQVQAFIENVPQSPVDAFTVSGNTITFTSAPPSGSSNIYVRYTSPITQVMQPTDGSVGTNQLAAGAVTTAKLADANVTVAKLSGSGVPSFDGIKFPASQVSSSDANTLDDYEEGFFTFTDQSGAGLSLTTNGFGYRNQYIKIGSLIFVSGSVTFPTTSNTNQAAISLPFTPYANGFYSGGGFVTFSDRTPTKGYQITIENGTPKFYIMDGITNTTNANWSGQRVDFQLIYRANA